MHICIYMYKYMYTYLPNLAALTKTFATWEGLGPSQAANAFVRENWPGLAALTKTFATWEELGPPPSRKCFRQGELARPGSPDEDICDLGGARSLPSRKCFRQIIAFPVFFDNYWEKSLKNNKKQAKSLFFLCFFLII